MTAAAVPGRWWQGHRRLALGLTVLTVLAVVAFRPDRSVQAVVLALAVVALGLPHGAVDHLVARPAWRRRLGRAWLPLFGLAYLALALGSAVAWLEAPRLALGLFLGVAVWHFGQGDASRGASAWENAARGILPVVGPLLFHPLAVAPVFAVLTDRGDAWWSSVLVEARPFLAVAWTTALVAVTARRRRDRATLLELAVLAMAVAALPPLLWFAVYFCLWHSPRHVLRLIARTGARSLQRGLRAFVRAALPATIGATALLLGAAMMLSETTDERLLSSVFVGLASLTVPHMLLVDPAGEARRVAA